MTGPILEARALSFRYPGGVRALDGLDLAFAPGSRNVVLGANGAGKSTLFMLLNGVLRPSGGQVFLNGEALDYGRAGLRKVRSKVGILFQDPDAQLVSADLREDISFGPMNLGLDVATVRRRVEKALVDTHLEDLADRPVHALSYGQKRRAGIAGLLAMEPEVLILDEPTAGLDHRAQGEFFELLDTLRADGLTVILSTHSIDLAYAWADRAFVLERGRLVASCHAHEFPEVFPTLPRFGFGLPRVIELQQALASCGLSLGDGPPPRDHAGLLRAIGDASLSWEYIEE
ncbi:energy-coupling factor ABC transporter ATP-binding protein [Holophaga foetida]|uniref:energy-coupling factor ABC transporter ATP-binding protein n=1 Tax=Holophaga foetida TaxID=35839 RepID=UPI0002471CE8|nr:ABC transporter ATP-binding protein [Holophaga foetida]